MAPRTAFDNVELYLVRVLHTVITERSVSRAALRLNSTQPAVSAQLRRLRALTGDPLLVRAGAGMAPTDTALRLVDPAARLLHEADRLFGPLARHEAFEPACSTATLRVAASDYLDPLFLPELVTQVKAGAPGLRLELLPLSAEFDYRRSLAAGEVDLVIGNWLAPPGELHLARLATDEVVCLMAADHPAAGAGRRWSVAQYLACEHVAPTPLHPGARGVIDDHLARLGLQRAIAVRSAHFGLVPAMVARSRLVLTTGRQFCLRYLDSLPLRIVRCPVAFPPLTYYQLWHGRTHASPAARWLRDQVREAAAAVAARPATGMPRAAARDGAPA